MVLNITVTEARSYGFVTAHPAGEARPNASNLNYVAGQTVPNLAVVKLGTGGKISLFNASSSSVALIADVAGYYLDGQAGSPGVFVPLSPTRLLDSRSGISFYGPLSGGSAKELQVTGRGGVPDVGVSAVVLNITATEARSFGFITAYPAGTSRPNASNLNYVTGQTVPNLAVVKVTPDGRLMVANTSSGSVQVIADIAGYYVGQLPFGAVGVMGQGNVVSETIYGAGWSSSNWARPDDVDALTNGDGTVTYVTHSTPESFTVETWNPNSVVRIGSPRTIATPGWPLWGGFTAGPDGNFYVLVGRSNPSENPNIDVMALHRYDRNWKLSGTALVKAGVSQAHYGIREPFDAGRADMAIVSDRLVIHMARLLFRTGDGLNHQTNLTIEVDLATMSAKPFAELGGYSVSSHSFNQFVVSAGPELLTIDHSDAYPRAVRIGIMPGYPTTRDVVTHDVLAFNGAIGDNYTGATVTDVAGVSSRYLIVGNSVAHPNAPNGALSPRQSPRNIYLVTVNPATGPDPVRWLTNYSTTGDVSASEPRIVVLGDKFVVLFTVWHGQGPDARYTTEYRLLNRNGEVLAARSLGEMLFASSTAPQLVGNKIFWLGTGRFDWGSRYLYGIDVSDPGNPKVLG